MTEGLFYCVVLARVQDFNMAGLADCLGRALSIPRIDSAARLARNKGILHRTGDLKEAETLKERLGREGVETFILPSAQLAPIPPFRQVRKAVPKPEGFFWYDSGGNGQLVPWGRFSLLCAGEMEETHLSKEKGRPEMDIGKIIAGVALAAATGIPAGLKPKSKKGEEKEVQKSSFACHLDIIGKRGHESFRITGSLFDYGYLAGRKEFTALLNFRKLALDVVGFLPGETTLRNRGVTALEKGSMRDFKYNSPGEFEQEKLWLLQLAHR
ncbi:MAG: hypothetical protein M0Z59_02595 [Nitrospiraceae bacterium]|nr:hypothetical protein [Nitrospiraceae bacterium]